MENSKRTMKIIKGLNTLKEGVVEPEQLEKNIDDLVVTTKDALDVDDEQAKDFVSGVVGEAENETGFNPVVQYHSDRTDETPFMINGTKWNYVNAIYPDGRKDIAVYRYGHDLAYDYKWFMDNVVGRLKNAGDVSEVNQEVMNDMIKQYGSKEAAEKVYYATANKQDRDPENFEMKENGEDYESVGRGVQHGIDPEVGADEYEEYRKLKDMLVKGELEGDTQIDEDNNPVKLKSDVAKVMAKLDMSSISPYLEKIDNPVEQAEMIAQFAEKIGVPKQRLSAVVGQLKILAKQDQGIDQDAEQQIEAKMSKDKLIEAVVGKKGKKVIKTVKVKDIK